MYLYVYYVKPKDNGIRVVPKWTKAFLSLPFFIFQFLLLLSFPFSAVQCSAEMKCFRSLWTWTLLVERVRSILSRSVSVGRLLVLILVRYLRSNLLGYLFPPAWRVQTCLVHPKHVLNNPNPTLDLKYGPAPPPMSSTSRRLGPPWTPIPSAKPPKRMECHPTLLVVICIHAQVAMLFSVWTFDCCWSSLFAMVRVKVRAFLLLRCWRKGHRWR